MTTKITYTSLKKKYSTIPSIFLSTFDEVILKALQLQTIRNNTSCRLRYEGVIEPYYPFITNKNEFKALYNHYSDEFAKVKSSYVNDWKSALPLVFDNVSPTIS